jgi:hypothetical protein
MVNPWNGAPSVPPLICSIDVGVVVPIPTLPPKETLPPGLLRNKFFGAPAV